MCYVLNQILFLMLHESALADVFFIPKISQISHKFQKESEAHESYTMSIRGNSISSSKHEVI